MIAALLIERKGSVGFPGKNLYSVLGRPRILMAANYIDDLNRL